MNTSIKTRAAALLAAIVVTFTGVYVVADYAYPEARATRLAATAR
jgi:hypothetical protein